jgi:signal transduction histidine kinase
MELDDSPAFARADLQDDELALRHARSELRRATQLAVAGDLVASITHDLRQPLTAVEMNISAAIHFLRRPAPAISDALEALHDALRQQHRMRDELQVLQDLAVRREPRWDGVEIVSLVREVVALVDTDAAARDITIDVDAADHLPTVAGDATLIRQALLNVVLDALEATTRSAHANGPIRIAVRAENEAVRVSVFHYGARDDAAKSEWGLALAQSIAAVHGGKIDLEGAASTGITVVTRWPTHRPTTLLSAAETLDA